MIAGVVFGHDSVNSLLRELARNVQLAQLRLQSTATTEPAETNAAIR